jgi:hypothetical protein
VVVPKDFYVAMEPRAVNNIPFIGADYSSPDGQSYERTSVGVWFLASDQDLMIRADVNPIGGAPVGGVVMPPNSLAVLAPWLAVIGVVGCVGTIVVVAKKRLVHS